MTAPKRLTVAEVAELLRVSEHHVRRLMAREGLPHIRIGERTRLVDREDLEAWIEDRKVVANTTRRRR